MTIKFRQFQKNSHVFAPIGGLIVAFCTRFIFRKSHKRTAPNAEQKFFTDSKTELGAFFTLKRNTRVNGHFLGLYELAGGPRSPWRLLQQYFYRSDGLPNIQQALSKHCRY